MSVDTPPAPAVVRARQLALGSPRAPRWARPTLWAVLVLAAALSVWNLSSIGNANSFYAASVLSGTQSWKALFFGSLDAGNFITVDKPPLAEWVMGLSCRVFGFGTWQMMLPVAAAGVASVALLYTMVRRSFGYVAATIAALVLALTPITVAINRDNNPDPFLVLLMLLGAAGCLRAIRTGRLAPLVWCAVAVGFAFDAKMLQGYMCLPAFLLAYAFAAKVGVRKRVRNLAVAGVALAASTFWYVVVADFLVSRDSRPYIGGSTDNTVWNLVIGYNGFGRVFGESAVGGSTFGQGANFGGAAGAGRLFNSIMGGQISWLIPFATIALLAGLVLRGRRPRTDMQRASYLLWGGWFGVHYLVFSFAEGTFHPYYTTAMAPGIAALTGAGGVAMYRAFRRGGLRWVWVLPAAITVSAVWAVVLLNRTTSWNAWLGPVVGVVAALSVAGLLVMRFAPGLPSPRRLGAAAAAAGLLALLAGPGAYAVDAATSGSSNGTNPTAGPSTGGGGFGGGGMRGGGGGGGMGRPGGQQGGQQGAQQGAPQGGQQGGGQPQAGGQMPSGGGQPQAGGGGFGGGGMRGGSVSTQLVSYLIKHQDGATWILAVSTDQTASELILQSRKPVASMGGWSGSDNAMTLDKLQTLVKAGKLHYVETGGRGNSALTTWIQQHGTLVKPSAYGDSSSTSTSTVYRLDPSDV
ncbi:ArnT family glycosyltransferase [Streptomyces sp. NPDC059373]